MNDSQFMNAEVACTELPMIHQILKHFEVPLADF